MDLRAYNDSLYRADEVINNNVKALLNIDNKLFYQPNSTNFEALANMWGFKDIVTTELLNQPFKQYYFEGSSNSLITAIKNIYGGCELKQWQDYGGNPYHFKINVNIGKYGFNGDWAELERVIEQYKNVRSVLESIDITIYANTLAIYTAVSRFDGERVTINPYIPTNLDITHALGVASYCILGEEITINTKGKIWAMNKNTTR